MPGYELITPEMADAVEGAFIVWLYGNQAGGAYARITSNIDGVSFDEQPDALPVPEALAMAHTLHERSDLEWDDPILIVMEAGAVGWDPAWGVLAGVDEPVNNQSANQMKLWNASDD